MNKRLTPMQAVRKYCVNNCMVGSVHEVKLCVTDENSSVLGECPLFRLRLGKNPDKLKVTKQIRMRCLDCSAYSIKEVKKCWNIDCELYLYRMGKNTAIKGAIKGSANLKSFKKKTLE